MSVCNALTFESFDLESSFFGIQAHLRNLHVNFEHQGHRVKVEVTGAKKCDSVSCLWVVSLRLKGNVVLQIVWLCNRHESRVSSTAEWGVRYRVWTPERSMTVTTKSQNKISFSPKTDHPRMPNDLNEPWRYPCRLKICTSRLSKVIVLLVNYRITIAKAANLLGPGTRVPAVKSNKKVTWQRWRSHHSISHSRKPHAASDFTALYLL